MHVYESFRRPARPQSLREGGPCAEWCFILEDLWLMVLSGAEPEKTNPGTSQNSVSSLETI